MRDVALEFNKEMGRVEAFLDAMVAAYSVAKEDPSGITSRKKFIANARKLRKTLRKDANLNIVAFAGAYLHVCAEYELTLRRLIERYMETAAMRCARYHHLPQQMRSWYPIGCAAIIQNIGHDRFKHLTVDVIVHSLANTTKNVCNLVGDAFSDCDCNFWPETIEKILCKRLGILKVWQKLAREEALQAALGITNPETVEQVSRVQLSTLLHRRNDTIHRGKSYYTPSESEVRDCIHFLKPLVSSLADVMHRQCEAL